MGRIAKNMAALLGSQLATWAISLVMLVVVPNYLGDKQFGRLMFAYAFVGFFGLVAGLGTGQFITKEIARDTSRVGYYVFNALVMNTSLAVLLTAAAIVAAHVLRYPAETSLIVGITCVGMVLSTLNRTLVAGLQGEQRMGKTAVWSVAEQYAEGGGLIAAVVSRSSLIVFALVSALTVLISAMGNGLQLVRQLRQGARLDLRLWKLLALGGLPFMMWSVVLTIYGSIDTPMLAMMAGDATVGWYTLAYKLISAPAFFASIVVTAFYPALSEHGAGTSPFFASLANRALRLVFFAGVPIAAGTALVAGDVISVLHYPAGFSQAVPAMRILALHVPVVGITMVLGTSLMARDRQKEWLVVGILAAVFNPLANLIAIPATISAFGNGAVGTAIVTVATELFMLGGAVYLRPSGVLDRATQGFLLRCALACLLMVAVVIAVGSTGGLIGTGIAGLVVKAAVGAASYGAASIILRTISVGEIYHTYLHLLRRARPSSASSTL